MEPPPPAAPLPAAPAAAESATHSRGEPRPRCTQSLRLSRIRLGSAGRPVAQQCGPQPVEASRGSGWRATLPLRTCGLKSAGTSPR